MTSRMRQMQPLALLSPDLHRKSVVPIVQSLTAVQSSKVQRSMTTAGQTVPGFREFLKARNEQQDLIFFFVEKKEHT
jgi:hypothetical protein